jgi:hypothetical protein
MKFLLHISIWVLLASTTGVSSGHAMTSQALSPSSIEVEVPVEEEKRAHAAISEFLGFQTVLEMLAQKGMEIKESATHYKNPTLAPPDVPPEFTFC